MRRRFPEAPIVAVGAIVLDRDVLSGRDRVLLVRRRNPPLAGDWSLPGGMLELGETLEQGVRRELREETGLLVEPVRIAAVLDRIHHDQAGAVEYHYVLIDYVCRVAGGTLCCASDALKARWSTLAELRGGVTDVAEATRKVICDACSPSPAAGRATSIW